jgi:D-lactate dehydrogenase (cytochrome)
MPDAAVMHQDRTENSGTPGVDAVITALRPVVGDRLTTSPAAREHHARGEGLRDPAPPDAVVFAETTQEVATIVRLCAGARVPVIPFGVGTSLEGHVQAVRGGVCIDLSRMDKVLAVSADDLDCRVEAGVTREALNAFLRDQGLFFPVDPGANATLGGMASTRASGTTTVRYGAMRELTLGLTVVTAAGEVIRTGGRARKSAAGYDLTRLFIGSEGTLGVITELQLRLFGLPEAAVAAVCQFQDVESAVAAVVQALQLGLPVARIELLDALQMRACIAYAKLDGFEALPTLFLEFHGSEAAVAETAGQMAEITEACGGGAYRWARRPEERTQLWKARHAAYYAGLALSPGREAMVTDACVPISNLAQCIAETRAEAEASGLLCPMVGHVGDGNFHVSVLFDPKDAGERAAAEALGQSIARRALRLGGTCTGEHGVGLHKLQLMAEEHGPGLGVMQAIKRALDPDNIMNPGKMPGTAPAFDA